MVSRLGATLVFLVCVISCLCISFSQAADTNATIGALSFGLSFKKAPKNFGSSDMALFQDDLLSAVSNLTAIPEELFFYPNNSIQVTKSDIILVQISAYVVNTTNATAEEDDAEVDTASLNALHLLSFETLVDLAQVEEEGLSSDQMNATWSNTVTSSSLDSYPFVQNVGGVQYISTACDDNSCSLDEMSGGEYGKVKAGTYRYDVAMICVVSALIILSFILIAIVLIVAHISRQKAVAATNEHKRLLRERDRQQQSSGVEMA